MRYLLAIYGDESQRDAMTPEEGIAMMQAYEAYTQEVQSAGVMLGGDGLQASSTATTVRVRDDERLVTDGPFAETREQLAGFYLLECKDLDEAIEWAAKIPGAQNGTIEVRPVIDYEGRQARAESPAATSQA
jgi:hypothetical protein